MNQCLATVAATLPDGREAVVREFFAGVHSGFFVEVGADRPQQESQTWHLEQLGWTGILVEPQPDLAEELRRKRSAQVFAVACSTPQNAGRSMRLHVAGALSALDRDRRMRRRAKGWWYARNEIAWACRRSPARWSVVCEF